MYPFFVYLVLIFRLMAFLFYWAFFLGSFLRFFRAGDIGELKREDAVYFSLAF